ncbi:MAG: sulfite exporter TauE/SafE family protein [Eubacteriales bacterium]
MEFILFGVALLATTIGAMSGMGGGIIIKPVMDAISGMDVTVINFMSSCTVLAMAMMSMYRGRKDEIEVHMPTCISLALGACIGGVVGKLIFDLIPENQAYIQSIILLWLNIFIYIYTKFKSRIKTLHVKNYVLSAMIGCALGAMSAFLGIGGGPINIAVLYFFFSTASKVTVRMSIFVILLSQISNLITVFLSGVPSGVNYFALVLMIVGGCSGAVLGGTISKKLTEIQIDDFFTDVVVAIIILNAYNVGVLGG